MSKASRKLQTGDRRVHCGRLLERVLFGRVQLCVGLALWVVVVLGCMSINIGGRTSPTADANGILAQDGKIAVRPGSEQTVHYPKAYSTPPNLEVTDAADLCDIIEQKETYFRVRFRPDVTAARSSITWHARGVTMPAAELIPASNSTVPGSLPNVTPAAVNGR